MHRKLHTFPVSALSVCVLVILFLGTGFSTYSQETFKDTVLAPQPTKVHSPRKATIYSAALPGLGQIYNRKYWKVPIVYGGFAALGYFINFNHGEYTKYRRAYSDILDEDPTTNSYIVLIPNYDPLKESQYTTSLRGAKDRWRRYRDLVVIGTAVFYAVNIIDASVDAHFFKFDISDDLSMNWAPGPVMGANDKTMGIYCRLTF